LKSTTVLHGDAADEELLLEETSTARCLRRPDEFREANILSAMLAKRLAPQGHALINKPYLCRAHRKRSIDVAISPQTVTIDHCCACASRRRVRVHSLRRGAAEALEVVVHGDATLEGHRRRIEDISAAGGHHLGRRGSRRDVDIAHHDTTVQPDDHLILFLTDRAISKPSKKLFKAPPLFCERHLLPVVVRIALV